MVARASNKSLMGNQLPWTAEHAREFARLYTQITEALLTEGVQEDQAREEARIQAGMVAYGQAYNNSDEHAPCPLCGRED